MTKKNEGERVTASEDVVSAAEEALERELGTEGANKQRKRKHEVRPDGSIAYFDELDETAALREQAEEIPARETGTTKEDQ